MVTGSLVAKNCPKRIVKTKMTYLRERVNIKCFWEEKKNILSVCSSQNAIKWL